MRNDPTITFADLALRLGITDQAIKKQIEKLKAQDLIRRIGSDKGRRLLVADRNTTNYIFGRHLTPSF